MGKYFKQRQYVDISQIRENKKECGSRLLLEHLVSLNILDYVRQRLLLL